MYCMLYRIKHKTDKILMNKNQNNKKCLAVLVVPVLTGWIREE